VLLHEWKPAAHRHAQRAAPLCRLLSAFCRLPLQIQTNLPGFAVCSEKRAEMPLQSCRMLRAAFKIPENSA
jgi:hypothetical protein